MRWNGKITQEQVEAIREHPLPAIHIAKYFGVSPRTIRNVRNFDTHKTKGTIYGKEANQH